jgi:hypothetical protein
LENRDGYITNQAVQQAYGGDKAKAEQAKRDQQRATISEASAFAILYNNLFFLSAYLVLGFYFLPNLPGQFNYSVSVILSAALINFVSNSSLKRKN